jgi:ATP-dependent Lon protease
MPKNNMNKRKNNDSDSSSESDSENEEEMDIHEYRKFLSKIFPSKHLTNKIHAGKKLKEVKESVKEVKGKESDEKINIILTIGDDNEYDDSDEDDSDWEDEETEDEDASISSTSSTEYEDDDDEDEETEEDEEEEKEEEEEEIKPPVKKYNTRSTKRENVEETKEKETSGAKSKTKELEPKIKPKPISKETTGAKSKTKETESKIKETKETESKIKETKETESKTKETKETESKIKETKETESKIKETTETKEINDAILVQLKEVYNKNPTNELLKAYVEDYSDQLEIKNKRQEKLDKKYKERNCRIFKKIIKDKNTLNDSAFFKKMDIEEQKKIIKELKEVNKITRVEKPYRISLLETNMPTMFKGAAIKKINSLHHMDQHNSEYHKVKHWVDNFMRIPFGNYTSLPISIEDGVEKCHAFMENAQKILNDSVYGLNDAKMQIMQVLGQLITNPSSIGSAIAIHGPPGTGKTSLCKEGISKILNRPFAFIALGGATDSSFLEGHSFTYEGSIWGKIVQILIDSRCMNPVIFFDELDKISETPKGEEIVGILTHLTDSTQNSQFHDKYFSEVEFDLSKCLFIFSYNDETKVNPILKDRMYKIQTKGYDKKQKLIISTNYLLPKIREQIKFTLGEVEITDEALNYIIEHNCNNEDGVRNLKRCLEIIHTKLNLYRLMKPDTNLFEQDMSLKVTFPIKITKSCVDKLIKQKDENIFLKHLYV